MEYKEERLLVEPRGCLRGLLVAVLALAAWGGFWFYAGRTSIKPTKAERRADTVTLERVTVRTDTVFQPKEIRRYVVKAAGGVTRDSSLAALPDSLPALPEREAVVYEDSMYYAVVSGWRATLDTLSLRHTERVRTERVTVEDRKRPRRVSVGLQAGYGLTPKGLQPYVGAGVSFRLF